MIYLKQEYSRVSRMMAGKISGISGQLSTISIHFYNSCLNILAAVSTSIILLEIYFDYILHYRNLLFKWSFCYWFLTLCQKKPWYSSLIKSHEIIVIHIIIIVMPTDSIQQKCISHYSINSWLNSLGRLLFIFAILVLEYFRRFLSLFLSD